MANWQGTFRSGLYPLWLIGANLMARVGGMVILILIGHSFSQDALGTYFQILAMVGLAVTATQAGTGPLLVRLAQNRAFRAALKFVALRILIALIASILIIWATNSPVTQFWPLILIPFAAALAPDWMIAAKTRFAQMAAIAVSGQFCGILMAVLAALTHSSSALYFVAPAISVASLVLAAFFAFGASSHTGIKATITTASASPPVDKGLASGLIGFTLLSGALPNLDFVLLGAENDTLFLAQRIFLFCAGLITAVASTLFAKQQTGHLRDIWLLVPMALVSGMLLLFPGILARTVYAAPSDSLINVLQTGAVWPLLLAIVTRQILILQETSHLRWVGWSCLLLMVMSALCLPSGMPACGIMGLITARLACLAVILLACQKFALKRQVAA